MKVRILNANVIKIIAAITMLIDHMGLFLFPQYDIFRMIGRVSMPIFSFLIAEGCRYTRSRFRHVSFIAALSVVYAIVYNYVYGEIYLSIFSTFTFSILMIYALQDFKKSVFNREGTGLTLINGALFLSLVAFVFFLNRNKQFGDYPFTVDYGFWGCILPVFAALADLRGIGLKNERRVPDNFYSRIVFFSFGVALLCLHSQFTFSWFAFLAVALLIFYNGKRGKLRLKYFFYIFYPIHMGVLYLISLFI